jgi:DNA-binding transcriptional regulator YhcF (GntR family)
MGPRKYGDQCSVLSEQRKEYRPAAENQAVWASRFLLRPTMASASMGAVFSSWWGDSEAVVIMISPVDERRDVEDQIVRKFWLEIARGAYREGETLPPSGSIARDLLVNPRKVQAAYRRLGTDGIVAQMKGQGHVVQPEAREKARARLAEHLRDGLRAALVELREVGCSPQQLRTAIDAAMGRAQ